MSRLRLLFCINWYYLLFYQSIVIKKSGAKLTISKGVKITKSKLILQEGANCVIGKDVIINKADINVTTNSYIELGEKTKVFSKVIIVNGVLAVGAENYIMGNGDLVWIQEGKMMVGCRNRVKAGVWIRFGGQLSIGDYNTINEETEIRCDENVIIGNCNQISMNIRIWDTNTHRMFNNEKDLETFIKSHYPNWNEDQKPKTKKVIIGDNNWIGEYAFIKGAIIGNHCVIGTRTMLIGKVVDDNLIATNKVECCFKQY